MDSQATGLGKTENDTAVATLGPAVCGHATAGALRENVPDIVWLPYDDSGNMTNDGHYSYTYDPENRLTQVQKPNPLALDMLAQAVDSELAFTTGGLGLWQRQTGSPSYHDGDCAQSAATSDNDEAWMETTVEGAGTLTFWWKVSSESGCDHLEFYLDNQLQSGHISGEVDWTQKSYTITGAGPHTLKWRYVKDGSSSFGDDCGWVDWVQWTGSLPPAPPAEPLRFYLDGVESYACRTGDWEQKSYTITGSGTHTLRWLFGRYTQDWSGVGYVDDVQWTGYIPQPPAPPEPLRFYIDGVASYGCRTGSWEQKSYTITGSGAHTLKWLAGRYTPDWSGTGYVDDVQWTGSMPPAADAWGTLNYLYDASGRRIEKRVDGRTITKYVYDGDSCIAEYDASGNLRRKYIYGPCTDEPICMIESTQTYAGTYYYHFDALGSVVALTSGNAGSMGNTVEVYEYDIYGRVGALDPNHPNRFMFTGREYDKETGLYYYRARYYNPQIGRFLQTDPVGYGAGMNLYRYCSNNPVGYTDPSGAYPGEANGVSFWGATHPPTNGAQYGDSDAFRVSSSDWINSFPMSSALDVLSTLSSLRDVGADLSQVYFQEHADPTNFTKITNPITGTTSILGSGGITGMEFGNDIIRIDESETFWKELGALLPEGATINFRSCWAGEDPCVLIKLAKLTGHPVTGCTGTVSDLGKDVTGSNYTLDGDLRMANPDGTWSTVWTPKVLPEGASTQFPAIPVQVPNPVPQPY